MGVQIFRVATKISQQACTDQEDKHLQLNKLCSVQGNAQTHKMNFPQVMRSDVLTSLHTGEGKRCQQHSTFYTFG